MFHLIGKTDLLICIHFVYCFQRIKLWNTFGINLNIYSISFALCVLNYGMNLDKFEYTLCNNMNS